MGSQFLEDLKDYTINGPDTLYYLKDYDPGAFNSMIHNPINLRIPTGPSGYVYSYLEDTTSSLYSETKSTDPNSESKYYMSKILDSFWYQLQHSVTCEEHRLEDSHGNWTTAPSSLLSLGIGIVLEGAVCPESTRP